MTNIKQLKDLNVDAIAVEVPNDALGFKLPSQHKGILQYKNKVHSKVKQWIDLPEGKWAILGSADKLTFQQETLLCDQSSKHNDTVFYTSWHRYMKSNNLTNEIILIKK